MIDLHITCYNCGSKLDYQLAYRNNQVEIDITPCEGCLRESYDYGYSAGYEEGVDDGEN